MTAPIPASQGIYLSLEGAIWIVACQAHLPVGAVANEKLLSYAIDALYVRIMAAGALHIAIHQLHLSCRIAGFTLRYQSSHQIGGILHRQHQAEGMRTGQVLTESIAAGPLAGSLNLAISSSLAHGHRAIVTAEAQTAGNSEWRLRIPRLVIRGAGIGSVLCVGQLLVPQRSNPAQAAMRSVTESTSYAS